MAKYDPSKAQFWLEIGGQPVDTFELLEFYGSESISQLYHLELSLASPVDNELNLPELLNQAAKVIILRDEEKKELHGILSELEEIGHNKDFAFFRAVLVPRAWKLSLNYQSRIFQNKSVPDIIKEVFKGAGLKTDDYKLKLSASYQPREYCVQYRETDFNFICRLMEYEGISFFFDHSGNKDVLVIADDKKQFPKIDSPDEIASVVGEGLGPADQETIGELAWHEKMVTGKVVLKDYNYRTPETALSAESQIKQESPGVYYEYGDHFKTAAQGKTLATIRNQELEATRRIITGSSDCRGFHAGYTFSLVKHYRDSLNGMYLLTQVSHYGSQKGGMSFSGNGDGAAPAYRNEFTCIPADVQYRPARLTPEPRIPGIMTARVESSGGEYAHLDEEGRYRVKMPFDMSDAGQGKASRAIRLAQPYTGSGYGMHFPVHAGTELVWACVDGNVDRPLGLSTVPNPSQPTPVAAQNKSQNIIQSAAGNVLIMDDLKDGTFVWLMSAGARALQFNDKDQTIMLWSMTGRNMLMMDDENQTISIITGAPQGIVLDDKKKLISIGSTKGHTIGISDGDSGENITISDKDGKNKIVVDISNKKIIIESPEGSIDLHAPNGTIDIKAATLNIETTGDTSLKAKSVTVKTDQDFGVKATGNVTLEATMDFGQKGMNVKSEASVEHKITGAMVSSEGSIQQDVKGTIVNVQGDAMSTIKGGVVMIN